MTTQPHRSEALVTRPLPAALPDDCVISIVSVVRRQSGALRRSSIKRSRCGRGSTRTAWMLPGGQAVVWPDRDSRCCSTSCDGFDDTMFRGGSNS